MSNVQTNFLENELGFYQVFQDQFYIFFGKKNCSLELLQNKYRQFEFLSVKQTHSNTCVECSSVEVIADAHFTDRTNLALIIKTADCMPAMVFDQKTNRILAIHAGWRGVENQIISKSIQFSKMTNPFILVGPHILQKSFEIDSDVFQQLYQRANSYKVEFQNETLFYKKESKFYLDLKSLVSLELNSMHLNYEIQHLDLDTVTSEIFHSFRREKANSRRNLSFIAKLK